MREHRGRNANGHVLSFRDEHTKLQTFAEAPFRRVIRTEWDQVAPDWTMSDGASAAAGSSLSLQEGAGASI
jgi:hypothetical protein